VIPLPGAIPLWVVGEGDMRRNGLCTGRGIKQLDGYMSELWRQVNLE
jgi:hypothetical protein